MIARDTLREAPLTWWSRWFGSAAPPQREVIRKGPVGTRPLYHLVTLIQVPDAEWPEYAGRDDVEAYLRPIDITLADGRRIVSAMLYVPGRLGLSLHQRDVLAHEISHYAAACLRLDPDPTHDSDGGRALA